MRHALFCKIAVRLALFIFIDYYLLSPFPGCLIDYEYIKSIAIADYFDQLMKPDYGAPHGLDCRMIFLSCCSPSQD